MAYIVRCPECGEVNGGSQLRCVKCQASLIGIPREQDESPPQEVVSPTISPEEQPAEKTPGQMTSGEVDEKSTLDERSIRRFNRLAVASLCLGILGFITSLAFYELFVNVFMSGLVPSFLPNWYVVGYEDPTRRLDSFWFSSLSALIGLVLGLTSIKGTMVSSDTGSTLMVIAGIFLSSVAFFGGLVIMVFPALLAAFVIYYILIILLENKLEDKPVHRSNRLAVASLCLGIIGFVASLLWLSIRENVLFPDLPSIPVLLRDHIPWESFLFVSTPIGLVSLVLGSISYRKRMGKPGMAKAGIFLGILAIVGGLPLGIIAVRLIGN